MIKAPAEEICGSGVSTSEKSMAAAAAPQGSVQECGTGSSTSLCPPPAPSCACSLPASHTHLHPLSWIRAAAYFCNQSEICRVAPSPSSCQPPLPCSAARASSFSQFVWSQPAGRSCAASFLSRETARISLARSSPHLRFVVVSAAA